MKKIILQILCICIAIVSCIDGESIEESDSFRPSKLNVHFKGFTEIDGTRASIGSRKMYLSLDDDDYVGVVSYYNSPYFTEEYPTQGRYLGSEFNDYFWNVRQYYELMSNSNYIVYWPYDENYGRNGVNEIKYENMQYVQEHNNDPSGLPIHYFSPVTCSEDDGSLYAELDAYEGLLSLTISNIEMTNWHSVRIETVSGDSIFATSLKYAPHNANRANVSPFTPYDYRNSIAVTLKARNFENINTFIVYFPIMPATYNETLRVIVTDWYRNSYCSTVNLPRQVQSGRLYPIHVNSFTPYHETVDLGLPSGRIWAKYNVGANGTTFYQGTRFAKDERDSVASLWGEGWRLPTKIDWDELMSFNGGFRDLSWYEGFTFASKGVQNENGDFLCFPYFENEFLNYFVADSVPYAIDVKQNHYMYSDLYSSSRLQIRLVRDPE